MSALRVGFALYSNAFSSSIPSELGDLTTLSNGFYLCMNSFTGAVPSELGAMTAMTSQFRLDTNQVRWFVSYTWVCACLTYAFCLLLPAPVSYTHLTLPTKA